jgi:hypothetical protein
MARQAFRPWRSRGAILPAYGSGHEGRVRFADKGRSRRAPHRVEGRHREPAHGTQIRYRLTPHRAQIRHRRPQHPHHRSSSELNRHLFTASPRSFASAISKQKMGDGCWRPRRNFYAGRQRACVVSPVRSWTPTRKANSLKWPTSMRRRRRKLNLFDRRACLQQLNDLFGHIRHGNRRRQERS